MEALEMIAERRSVRKYKNERVSRELMTEIIALSSWAPSWANTQIARYTVIDNPALIAKISQEGVNGFTYNMKTLQNAPGVVILSYVKGKSGKLDAENFATTKTNTWEMFDAGIACQTFCLAAHAKGVGTCIFGVIDDLALAKIAGIPEDESVAALITYGFEQGEHVKPTSRLSVDQIMRVKEE